MDKAQSGFSISVTGDTGFDIYTEYVTGYIAQNDRVKPKAAFDLKVPAGASFIKLAIATALDINPDNDSRIQHVLPREVFDDLYHNVTQHKFLVEMSRFGTSRHDDEKTILRVKETWPLSDNAKRLGPDVFESLVDDKGASVKSSPELLIIHDGDGSWRQYPQRQFQTEPQNITTAMSLVSNMLAKQGDPDGAPRIVVNLRHLPEVKTNSQGELEFRDDMTFWRTLATQPDKVCIVCSANVLRREGAAISRRLSWEQTIEDLARDLIEYDRLRILGKFQHLIIRFGVVGAIHITRKNKKKVADLVFAPTARAGYYRDPIEEGNLVGENVMLISSLCHLYANNPTRPISRKQYCSVIMSGLTACMKAYDAGYQVPWYKDGKLVVPNLTGLEAGRELITSLFKEVRSDIIRLDALPATADVKERQLLGVVEVPETLFNADRIQNVLTDIDRWEMLKTGLDRPTPATSNRINVASAIVLFGYKAVLNRPISSDPTDAVRSVLSRPPATKEGEIPDYKPLPKGVPLTIPRNAVATQPFEPASLYVPVATFGKLVVVERDEIESLRSIRNLIKAYYEQSTHSPGVHMPISIAVFGPPGSGKSFAVKQIAGDINSGLHNSRKGLETIECNVAQFRDVNDLGEAITRASMIATEGKLPLLFFDEFDCAFQGNALGWLKYFLAPMQDGTFNGPTQTIRMTRAIFVFAGGVSHTFEQFAPSFTTDAKQSKRFARQKGPDFVSRLRGHINILPINSYLTKDDSNPPNEIELKPVIRRSIILRGLMEARGLMVRFGSRSIAQIDEDVLYALLTIDRYHHGTRSMEAILQMCTKMDGRIEKASLPSRAQMNMHVNADEFLARIYRGRSRPTLSKPSVAKIIGTIMGDLVTRRPTSAPHGKSPDGTESQRVPAEINEVNQAGDANAPASEKLENPPESQ